MVVFCPRHRIGYNDDLDPVCPQCSMSKWEPVDPLQVDHDPESKTYGQPIYPANAKKPARITNVLGRRP